MSNNEVFSNLTEDKLKSMIAFTYELLAKQKSQELGVEITCKTTVKRKEEVTA